MNASTRLSSAARLVTLIVTMATSFGLSWRTAWGQSEDFNSGSAPGWAHYDVGDIGQSVGIPGLGATYTFPPDAAGGYSYHIYSPPDAPYDAPPYGFGPSRALAFRPDVAYSGRFSVGADLVA